MNTLNFCENFVYLDKAPISFRGRPYLAGVYAVEQGNLILRASRQVEKSTFLAMTIIHEVCTNPKAKILFVSPRVEQARVFSHTRFLPIVHESPMIRRTLLGKGHRLQVTNMDFSNGARLHIRAAFRSADPCRGLSANMLLVDEVQDVAAGDLPVLEEVLSHAQNARTILAGTPKLVDNHLEGIFNRSTANLWTMACEPCGNRVTIDERCLGASTLVCPKCQRAIDPTTGCWVPNRPESTWGQGFSISHPMVPWLDYDDILARRQSYDPVRFRNEVLGLPTTLGEHAVTRAELEACCGNRPMARTLKDVPHSYHRGLFAGVDWGGGVASRTVLVIGTMRQDFSFEVVHISALQANEDPNRVVEEVSRRCNEFRVAAIAADGGGNGHVFNRLLFGRVEPPYGLYAIFYSAVEHQPTQEGVLTKWTVNRSGSIGVLFGRVKQKRILFPDRKDTDRFLDEFACEAAVYDDIQRAIKYVHPETQPDDCLHATNYALLIATRAHNSQYQFD